MPVGIPPSTRRRSFVALSSVKRSTRCRFESAIRPRTLSPRFDAMNRCVSVWRTSEVFGNGLDAATTRVEEPANGRKRLNTAASHVFQRRDAAKDRTLIWKTDPPIGERLAMENVECLEDADQIR